MNRNLADILNLLSKLTVRRFINILKVLAGYYLSRLLKRPVVFGMPVSVSLEPTTSCNLRCPECPSGLRSFTRPTGMMKMDVFSKTLDEINRESLYINFYFQGEPFLNKDFLTMVNKAGEQGLYTAASTNAHYLTLENAKAAVESGLDRLIISLDGTTQEVYEQYRIGGNLSTVIEGAKNIVAMKKELKSKTPYVVFQFLVVGPNEHQIQNAKLLAKETGVDGIAFKTAQIYDYKKGSPLIPSNEKYSRYQKQNDGSFRLKNKLDDHCWRLWNSTVITWDGQVVPCCFDKDASYSSGSVTTESFSGIWKGEKLKKFRAAVLRSRKEIDICTNCSEGTTVWN